MMQIVVMLTAAISGGKEPKVGYQPIIEKPNFGALLEIRPTLMQSDSTVVVDLKSTLTVAGEQPAEPGRGAQPASIAPPVDRIAIETQEFATTLRMPLEKPTLVGGLTYVPMSTDRNEDNDQGRAGGAERAAMEKPQLYLVLEVR